MSIGNAMGKIHECFQALETRLGNEVKGKHRQFAELLMEIEFILQSVNYHQINIDNKFRKLIEEVKSKHAESEYVIGSNIKTEIYFELYSFLYAARVGLDKLTKLNALLFKANGDCFPQSFGDIFSGNKYSNIFKKYPDLTRFKKEWHGWAGKLKDYRDQVAHYSDIYHGNAIHVVNGIIQTEILMPDNPEKIGITNFTYKKKIKVKDYVLNTTANFISFCEWNLSYIKDRIPILDFFKV